MSRPTPKYHPIATAYAQELVRNHQAATNIVLWSGWFCPFSQRTWIALEEMGLPYQYKEVNPYLKEEAFLAVSPKGLTPGLKVADKALHDSSIINEFLVESFESHGASLLPKDPYLRAQARLAIDFINKSVVPAYFRLLQAQPDNPTTQAEARREFTVALGIIAQQRKGKFFFGENISLVDIAIAPWAVRDFIAADYRGFQRDQVPSWGEWAKVLEQHPTVQKTSSDASQYVQFNGTFLKNEAHSSVGRAAQSGQAIP
ncbi:hypothetical protein TRIATDRAFT_83908 [Trichoderma atroviride IMI 206040]|uniref:Glutathione S-transferase n=1 Tax=Hypocrea atroviridis (strain ATCC 20476 / IMI 206040) TaxID=452589 RepID=G9NE44_HYPAI|nr:uncharacterized protein TRIATDRAFT_83908 [Trichoderma atroviride IMI 206040]EHK51077.1 hypothetical protein TRIATDRAFT_83908 [Trichoderma atroviride IMI 206040]